MIHTRARGSRGESEAAGYALAALGVLLAAFVAWIVEFSQPDEVEQVAATVAAVVARREAPESAVVTSRATADEILLTVIGVPSPEDQMRLLSALARSQAYENWQPIAVSFGEYEDEPEPATEDDPETIRDATSEDAESSPPPPPPPREVRIDRVVHVVDGQVAPER